MNCLPDPYAVVELWSNQESILTVKYKLKILLDFKIKYLNFHEGKSVCLTIKKFFSQVIEIIIALYNRILIRFTKKSEVKNKSTVELVPIYN